MKVISFRGSHNIDVPSMSTLYVAKRVHAHHQRYNVNIEHHYRVDIFNTVIDAQLQELNNIFYEKVIESLCLSCALDPREWCKDFKVNDISKLVHKCYLEDFTEVEKEVLRVQLSVRD